MHLLHLLAQRGRPNRRALVFLALVAASHLAAVLLNTGNAIGQLIQPQIRRTPASGTDIVSGVYLPTDRSLSRAITRARERLADHEYHEVLAFLQGVLARDEDSFLERAGEDHQQLGLKATARQLIGDLPPEGHDAYELLHGATARRQLEAAISAGDRDALAKVVRQFFHTSAGYEAALVLAEMEADQNHRLAAAELYRELIETPRAAAQFEPQLSVAAALNLLAAGQPDDATAILRALIKRNPAAQIVLSGKAAPLPGLNADPIAWLYGLVGQPLATVPRDANWLTLHGDPSRNSQSAGGRPHLRARWEARVVNEPSVESYLSGRGDDFLQRGVVAIPGARPIAVGDVIVMRTPENVVAVDWQTGKRVWETRDEEELQSDIAASEPTPAIDREQWAAQGKPLEERIWDDALLASLSSDGKRVFIVRGLSLGRDEEVAVNWQAQLMARGGGENIAATNQLAAYDIATQGKLAWELDGGRTTGALSGAFFLGAPLAIDNTLYVMAEIRSALYLIALEPATGHIQWQQQLVGLEQSISLDPARRKAGATPSYAGGILVCPTAASTVVAIDVVKREFAWVYHYAREAQSAAELRQFWAQQAQPQLVRTNNQWLDSSAVIADGRVLLTPPDSSEIHCLDLHSGKLLWHHRQNDSLFLGAVDKGNALLIGAQSVVALRLSDGTPAWDQETLKLPPGALPAGQGYLSDGNYFLPLTSGQIAEIDMANGKLASYAPSASNISLGNLICYRGSVLSQSALVLDKFEQLVALRHRTEVALARNPNDATAIRELAELTRADGQKPQAVRLLKHAYELSPDDPVTQEMLVELLLEELAADYATFREDVPLVARLVHNRDQQIELLRIDAAGQDGQGQRLAAFDAYLKLADFTAEEPAYLRIDDNYTVRSDRWVAGRLASLWASASADERAAIGKLLAARRPALENPRTAAELRHYLAHLGQLPGATDVRLALANYLVERGRPQEAEIELLELIAGGDEKSRAAASDLMAKLSEKAGPTTDHGSRQWPRGHVDAEVVATTAPAAPRDRPAPVPNDRQNAVYRQLRIEQDFWPQASAMRWFVATDCSEIVGRNSLGDDVFHLAVDPNSLTHQYRDSGFLHGARLGHLLYVALGGQITAIDSRQDHEAAEGDVLWPSQSPDGSGRDAARPRRSPSATQARANRRPVYHNYGRKRLAGSPGGALGSLGPVTPHGVVVQDDDELKCVDPLSGVTLWSRTDIPQGCELFGDGELAFAADVSGNVAYVVRVIDGQLLEKRNLPNSDWLLTAGRNIAQLGPGMNHGKRVMMITVTDVWSQKPLYQAEFSNAARISLVEPNAVATFDPSGQFRLIDVQTGNTVIDEKLGAVPDLQAIYTMRTGDDLFLFVSSQVQTQFVKPIGQQQLDYPIVNGPVYAFNLTTGKQLWPGPALIRNRGIVLSQPPDVPFLAFGDRQTGREATGGGGSQLRVLCLDKRTGETVYRNDRVQDSSNARFRVHATSDTPPTVALEMGAATIQLTMTERPRPPQPPANDDLESTRETVERGLRGLGTKLLRGAMEKSTPNSQPQPGKPTRQQRVDAPPAKNSGNQTDDD